MFGTHRQNPNLGAIVKLRKLRSTSNSFPNPVGEEYTQTRQRIVRHLDDVHHPGKDYTHSLRMVPRTAVALRLLIHLYPRMHKDMAGEFYWVNYGRKSDGTHWPIPAAYGGILRQPWPTRAELLTTFLDPHV